MAETFSKRSVAAKYMGSFPVAIPDIPSRAEFVRSQLEILRYSDRFTPVLLIVSLAGIKVCSPDGKCVQMAHALRRIFYATCEPQHAQFSFLAREPGAHFSLQYCHSFITESAEQILYVTVRPFPVDNRVRLKWKLETVASFKADGSLPLHLTTLPAFRAKPHA